jgi:chitodextrinase
MWEYILQRSAIDIIALQDGVGAGHATVSQLLEWFGATKNAITNKRPACQLWSDAENFNLDWKPMGIRGFVDDLIAVQSYVSNYTSFAYNHYTSPQNVPAAYHNTYRDYALSGVVEAQSPTAPGSLSATAQDSITINLSWTASTDNYGVAGYKIYRNSELVNTIYNAATTSYSDSQLSYSTTYSYTIAAFDAAGNISANSNTASATTPAGPDNPTNHASGRPYTASISADAGYPDTGGTELTDGVYGTNLLADPAWQARNTAVPYSFVIDLGSVKTIEEVVSDWMQYKQATVLLPVRVTYYVSNDNVNFTLIGYVDKPSAPDSVWHQTYRLINLNVSGRYVKAEVTPTGWGFVDEIEARQ